MEFKLITPQPITWTYFETNLSRFGLVGLPREAILNFQMFTSQPFEDLPGSNIEFKLIIPKPITRTYFETNLSRFGLAGFPLVTI